MGRPEFRQQDRFTYRDYLTWPEDERWELLDGIPYSMTPAPSRRHQEILIELASQIHTALRGHSCRAYCAPFDVRLPSGTETGDDAATVVQPDIAVICDETKLDERGCAGAPDFIIEIVSPGTAARDQLDKVVLYEKHGVREYWILHPIDGLLTVRLLGADGRYGIPRVLLPRGKMAVSVLNGLLIDFDFLGADHSL